MRQPAIERESVSAKGILKKEVGSQAFRLTLYEPHPDLRHWIEYYWAVAWDLGQDTFAQTVVTNPAIDLSFENDAATNGSNACLVATGVASRAYHRTLRGRADIIAAHFHPGMFRSWWGAGVNALTSTAERLTTGARAWEAAALEALPGILAAPNEQRVAMLDTLLLAHRPPRDGVAEAIRDLVHAARNDRSLWDSAELAQRRGVSTRTNQRDFLDYVGIGPKWVVQRYRVQAAIDALDKERLGDSPRIDLTELALSLGYYDSAHFSRDFRAVTGYSPAGYRKGAQHAP